MAVYVFASLSSSFDLLCPRYILPAISVLTVFGGRILIDAVNLFFKNKETLVASFVTFVVALMPVYHIAAADLRLVKPDTRIIAREWIDQNISIGTRIFIEGATVRPAESTVPLQYSRENILRGVEYFRERDPGKAKYFQLKLQVLKGRTYDLVTVLPDDLRSLQYYKDIGVQYFILQPDAYGPTTKRYAWPELVSEVRFDPDITLLERFAPDSRAIRDPLIEIYELEISPESN